MMNPLSEHVLTSLKIFGVILLLMLVFYFFYDRTNNPTEAEQIEAMLEELEKQVQKVTTSKEAFEYPIQRRAAAEYTLAAKTIEDDSSDSYLFICAVSSAVGMVQRAQTLINVGLDHRDELTSDVDRMLLILAPADSMCEEVRAIAMGFYVPAGTGWPRVSPADWQWLIRTSNANVSAEEIEATELYLANKTDFVIEYGQMNYSDKLDAFVAEQLGRVPKYVTAGMWNDDFVKQ